MRVLLTNLMMLAEERRFVGLLAERGVEVVVARPEQFCSEAECMQLVGEIDGWLAGDDKVTASVLDAALPRLKVISKWGTGLDSIDLLAAAERGVPVYNTPAAFRDAVAEVALAFMLELARNTVRNDNEIRQGAWPKARSPGLVDKHLGLVGFGAIGQGIAKRAQAFAMNVSFFDPFYAGAEGEERRCETLPDLLKDIDYLCLACNMSPENYHIIGAAELALMPQGASVVNVARGPLIDEKALIGALQSGHIGGAGLDVFEVEPLPMDNPLRRLENVVLGSHNANNVVSVVEKVHANTLANLFQALGIADA